MDLLKRQLKSWNLAQNNYEALRDVKKRHFTLRDLRLTVQFNPARKVSTTAKTDSRSLSERPCFLCKGNRPEQQISEEILPGWELLVNPFPIFEPHYTIASHQHIAQMPDEATAAMLASKLPGMVVFYNDDGAGASAPDHRHFQAVNLQELPLISLLEERAKRDEEFESATEKLNLPFKVETGIYSKDKKFQHSSPVNEYFWLSAEGNVRYVVIPRKAHRPECYFADPPIRRTISPGAIDMAGVLITPFEEDFEKLSLCEIERIYSEVAFK